MESSSKTKLVLFVGLNCLDIINICETYPLEDSDERIKDMVWRRGGNASNNCTVFNKLSKWHKGVDFDRSCAAEYLGTVSDDLAGRFLMEDFNKSRIKAHGVLCKGYETPTSTVIINSANGSRTILHSNKNFPELTLNSIKDFDFSVYDWIHFQGRNVDELPKIVDHIRSIETVSEVRISVELEKPRSHLKKLLKLDADVFFLGKDFAVHCGYSTAADAISGFRDEVKSDATLICMWGEQGIQALDKHTGDIHVSGIFPPKEGVIDTLGAGDTCVAAIVFAMSVLCMNLGDAIVFGSKVAGAKCGTQGFDSLDSWESL